jgi:alkane 1-monooxygenase
VGTQFHARIAALEVRQEPGAEVAWKYSIPFFFLAMVPLGFGLGGAWSFLAVVLLPLAMTFGDVAFGEDAGARDGARFAHRLLVWLYIPLQVALTGWAAAQIFSGALTSVEAAGLTASLGVTAGIFGFIAAHEMVHSPQRSERVLGLLMLASVLYMQFRIAHIYGHHRRAATREDPASARQGESAYHFVPRSAAGQMREAWAFEAARLRLRGERAFSLRNRVLCYLAIETLLLVAIATLSWRVLVFFLLQSALAIFMLEIFNYVAHYGLERRQLASGEWERLGPQHSWNSSRAMNNAALFNMGRHSDHHRAPARAYQRLAPVGGARELPTGYAGAILMALIPPLWRKIMDSRLAAA